MSLLLLQCRMKVQPGSVVRDHHENRKRLSFTVEVTSPRATRFPDELFALLEECGERVVCCQSGFMFYGAWVDLPPITMIRPSIASLEAALQTIGHDLPHQRHCCKVSVYAVSCHNPHFWPHFTDKRRHLHSFEVFPVLDRDHHEFSSSSLDLSQAGRVGTELHCG